METEKIIKRCKYSAIIYFLLWTTIIVARIIYKQPLIPVEFIVALLAIGLYKGAKDNKKYGSICGIAISILLFISRNTIYVILGIFLLINSINLLRVLK